MCKTKAKRKREKDIVYSENFYESTHNGAFTKVYEHRYELLRTHLVKIS